MIKLLLMNFKKVFKLHPHTFFFATPQNRTPTSSDWKRWIQFFPLSLFVFRCQSFNLFSIKNCSTHILEKASDAVGRRSERKSKAFNFFMKNLFAFSKIFNGKSLFFCSCFFISRSGGRIGYVYITFARCSLNRLFARAMRVNTG
jgi:hypothetical protein